jgi:fructose-bisphosphate aldolase class II
MLVRSREILADARMRKYGIPGLLGGNLEMVVGQVKAAEDRRSPLILVFNQGVTPEIPLELGMSLLVEAAKSARVPVATILDHGHDLESIVKAIRSGTSSVMFDGSCLPYEENVRKTAEIVRIAHAVGVCVEAELGSIVGSSISLEDTGPEAAMTDPRMAAEFVDRTGVDTLAISFGNAHGVYRGEPNLDLERVQNIYSLVDIPLVMHGGSGLVEDDYARLIESGISKVCYYTAMARSVSGDIREMMVNSRREDVIYHMIISQAIDCFYGETKALLDLLGCSGKAV